MSYYRYILAFGSNLGDRHAHCQRGLHKLTKFVEILQESRWLNTKPLRSALHDTSDHEEYVNFVVEAVSPLSPLQLFQEIQSIEDAIGHDRSRRWLPRALDIDILFCAVHEEEKSFSECQSVRVDNTILHVPHPAFGEREFLQNLVYEDLGITCPEGNVASL
jgi:2-amino-4-hydroxy-6-hydroxymethyldihydropteridine diphosphokinase